LIYWSFTIETLREEGLGELPRREANRRPGFYGNLSAICLHSHVNKL